MSRLLRIAAREYLSYVRTVGFWLSLAMLPLVIAVSSSIPIMMERSSPPTRLFVVDVSHQGLGAAVISALRADPTHKPPLIVSPPPVVGDAPDLPSADAAIRAALQGQAAHDRRARAFDVAAVIADGGHEIHVWTTNIRDGELQGRVQEALSDVTRERRLIAAGVSPALLSQIGAAAPKVVSLSPQEAPGAAPSAHAGLHAVLPQLIGIVLGFLLWSVIITGASILLNSVIEEKSSRILEVLLTSASVPEIMSGKILGVMGVTGTVLATWVTGGAVVAHALAPGLLTEVLAALLGKGLIIYFGLYFVVGYILYASIFTAVGAFCETNRDAQTLLGPMMVVLSIPMIFMGQSISHPDAPILGILAWIPFFTPFLMVTRVVNEPPLWQIAGTLVLMLATTVAVVLLSGRAFRAGSLSVGKVDRKTILAAFVGRGG